MNRLLDRSCLLTLAVVLLALTVSVSSRVVTAAPAPDCSKTCQMVYTGVKCFNGATAGNAIEYTEQTCFFCDPFDPDNCRFSADWGTSCFDAHSMNTVRFATMFSNCPCNNGAGLNYKYAEAWTLENYTSDTARFPLKFCISI